MASPEEKPLADIQAQNRALANSMDAFTAWREASFS
jgi:hypothetical protein